MTVKQNGGMYAQHLQAAELLTHKLTNLGGGGGELHNMCSTPVHAVKVKHEDNQRTIPPI